MSCAFCQTGQINDTLHWNESRRLTWADFKGEALEYTGFAGECFCMNLANFERPNFFSKTTFTVISVFDRSKSWVSPKTKNGIGLLFFQTMFDLYELHARELRKELSGTKFGADPTAVFQEKYNTSMTALTNEYNEFRKETKLGQDSDALLRWARKVKEGLNSLNDYR